jgi:hypothetical protein
MDSGHHSDRVRNHKSGSRLRKPSYLWNVSREASAAAGVDHLSGSASLRVMLAKVREGIPDQTADHAVPPKTTRAGAALRLDAKLADAVATHRRELPLPEEC